MDAGILFILHKRPIVSSGWHARTHEPLRQPKWLCGCGKRVSYGIIRVRGGSFFRQRSKEVSNRSLISVLPCDGTILLDDFWIWYFEGVSVIEYQISKIPDIVIPVLYVCEWSYIRARIAISLALIERWLNSGYFRYRVFNNRHAGLPTLCPCFSIPIFRWHFAIESVDSVCLDSRHSNN